MQSVVLLFSKKILLNDLVNLFSNIATNIYSTEINRYTIERENNYISITLDNTISNEYEVEELEILPFHIRTFILFEYSKLKFAKETLKILSENLSEFWIDISDAEFIDNQEFLVNFTKDPKWDWR